MNNRSFKHGVSEWQLSLSLSLFLSLSLSLSRSARHNDSSVSFDNVVSLKALFAAWEKFRRGKRTRKDVLAYERYLEANVLRLHDELVTGVYKHDAYQPFTICDPKQRRIHKATVKDRLVHQAVVSAIEPLFERQFIYDSYSCRTGKGTHAAVGRLQRFLRQASCNNTRTVYALKCDVRQFFASVDHWILSHLLARRISDQAVLELLQQIIQSHGRSHTGIPLGNLTSQLFANVYLHELDWWVKHTLAAKYYLRYCDDFILLSNDRQELLEWAERIGKFLEQELLLELHPNKITIRTWQQGIDFLGYVTKPHCKVLRSKTRRRMVRRVDENNLSSYLGLCSHASSFELQTLLENLIW